MASVASVDSPDVDEWAPARSARAVVRAPRPGRRLVLAGAVVVGVLVGLHLVVRLVEPFVGPLPAEFLRVIDVHREESVPTFVNTVLLVGVAGAVALVVGLARGRSLPGGRTGWTTVGLVALVMAADEALILHERLLLPVGSLAASVGLETGSYRWILPGIVLAGVGVVVFARWSGALPRPIRRQFLVALALFGAGALGVEMVSGWIDNSRGIGRLYHVVTGLEELLEMTGVLLAIDATLGMLAWTTTTDDAVALRLRAWA